jgi:hypothetical protein
VGVLVCGASLFAVTPSESSPAAPLPLLLPSAPACSDARAYFAEQLEAEADIGRATLLTHAEDATIPQGEGVILIVPRQSNLYATSPATTKARALRVADAIPCTGKLALRVEEPTYVPFTIDAELSLETGADRDATLHDADEQVRELFQPDARAVYNAHVDFGASEKHFGYRVRHALHQVLGVKTVHLTINGRDGDVALSPRDFPTLRSLAVH